MDYPEFLEGATSDEMEELLDLGLIQALGHGGVEDLTKIANIFTVCLNIFIERNMKRQDTWKMFGHKDSFTQARSKLARAEKLFITNEQPPDLSEDLDDLYDLINYAAFMIINLQEGR